MTKFSRVLAPTLALGMIFGVGSVSAEDSSVTIEAGDTLYEIANEHDVSLNKIYELNPNLDPRNLQIGTEVQISVDTGNDNSNSREVFHTIEPGETMQSIANLHKDLTLEKLKELNPDLEEGNLEVGTEVQVREMNKEDGKVYHTIEPGNTLYGIAELYDGVTVNEIMKLNPDIDPRSLSIGSEVRVK